MLEPLFFEAGIILPFDVMRLSVSTLAEQAKATLFAPCKLLRISLGQTSPRSIHACVRAEETHALYI
jgi:hypothetical protein